ncbi:transposase [Streptomyces phaeochromogenes]|nr:transposase [Streptomyces phaeochromogenes]
MPPYSPEPNPDELLNTNLKHSLPRQHPARDQTELTTQDPPPLPQTPPSATHHPRPLRRPRTSTTPWTKTP